MRLAIADPPYLGRGARWYGAGRGSGGKRHVADFHPEAAVWDQPESHTALVERLCESFDGWAIAAAADSLPVYLAACPSDVRLMIWHRRNAPPSGSRIRNVWEPVIVRVPIGRRGRGLDIVNDVLDASSPRQDFAGSKPAVWTRWVLAALGYQSEADTVEDLFNGSGAVAAAADGMLSLNQTIEGA